MELCFNLEYLSKDIGISQAAKTVKEAGFHLLDYTPDVTQNWRGDLGQTQSCFERNGLSVYQCHAPFNRYHQYGSAENHKKLVDESLSAAIELSASYLVLHGDEFDFDRLVYSPEAALRFNYEYFAPVVERAEKHGVGIAFENVFEDDMNVPRNCSKTEDLNALIEKFHCDAVCCCWDFGHGAVSYQEKQSEAIEKMGNKIRCTHVHDNYLNADLHLVPYLGKIDWVSCVNALKLGGLPEVFSFELVYGHVPATAAAEFMGFLHRIGQRLLSI